MRADKSIFTAAMIFGEGVVGGLWTVEFFHGKLAGGTGSGGGGDSRFFGGGASIQEAEE